MRTGDSEPYEIVAVAASAGGVTALSKVLGELPTDFPLPVVIVQHLDPRHHTVIAEVLGPAREAAGADGEICARNGHDAACES